jgi:hypothetical protein
MSLKQVQRIDKYLNESNNLDAIRIKIPENRFQNYFSGSASLLFRSLKNGLHTFNKKTNREFFSGLSGVYFTYDDSEFFQMIILYENQNGSLDQEELIQRIKKLIGIDAEIELGDFLGFKNRILEMTRIKSLTQLFGEAYFS